MIESFEVNRLTLNLATPSGSIPPKRKWNKESFAFCLLVFTLAGKFI
ncbi:rCG29566 [Rattus norvegicus]|uniref:RCG29566 n=1 Tax=Rattus norvegicus TaxID=10116 RepID=A6ILY1_RAT|nr:rCG29566 [Rattus norvegicus]